MKMSSARPPGLRTEATIVDSPAGERRAVSASIVKLAAGGPPGHDDTDQPVHELVDLVLAAAPSTRWMRDPTRGGLGTICK